MQLVAARNGLKFNPSWSIGNNVDIAGFSDEGSMLKWIASNPNATFAGLYFALNISTINLNYRIYFNSSATAWVDPYIYSDQ